MSRSDQERLADMLMAAGEIASVVGRGRGAFDGDFVLRRAIERSLEILGEAAKSVSAQLAANHPEVPWSEMAKVRDRLSHHYHRIDPAQLWMIAVQHPAAKSTWTASTARAAGPDGSAAGRDLAVSATIDTT